MADIPKALSRALRGRFTLALPLDLGSPHRFIVFSDQHKGADDGGDEFRKCKAAYVGALNHYRARGFALILLGDVEELWEQGFKRVERAYSDVLLLEGSFPIGKYIRIWGNHDDEWMSGRKVKRLLARYMPEGRVYEAIRFHVSKSGTDLGMLLLLHGHQGRFASDKIRGISRTFVRLFRLLQRFTSVGKTTPAKDVCLRGSHDTAMYRWASSQEKLVLIAGHTHRPVWSSRTHLQKLQTELDVLERDPTAAVHEVAAKRQEIERRREKDRPCDDTIKTRPCYFNTGCCKFDDGDITGIELEDGTLRLVKWGSDEKERLPAVERTVLENGSLEGFFELLSEGGRAVGR